MGREAQGKSLSQPRAERSKPAASRVDWPVWAPSAAGQEGGHRAEVALTALRPELQPAPGPPLVPGTCPAQHLRLGATPLLHSRKIFVQGLGTAKEEIKATVE